MFRTTRPIGIPLHTLLDCAQAAGAETVHVTSCTSDARQVQPGDAFFAITTATGDGHDDALLAVDRGAAAIVAERRLPVFEVPQFIVDDSRTAFGQLCQALVGNPATDLKLIGVTGSSGKTSVTELLAAVLKAAGACVGTLGTHYYDDGLQRVRAFSTTPSPPLLAQWLARMGAAGCSHGVMEVSSTALAEASIAGVPLDAACVTNIDRDHLDWHGTVENYRRAKARIFDHLQFDGVAVLNADDQACCRLLGELPHPALTYGMYQPADVTGRIVERCAGEQTFIITAGSESAAVRSPIIGAKHVSNCLAAASLGLSYGIDLMTIARGLEAVAEIPLAMQRIDCGQPFTVWLDSADTPARLRSTLQAVREVTAGRLICCTLQESTPALEQVLAQLADATVAAAGNQSGGDESLTSIAAALQQAQSGDALVVVAGRASAGSMRADAETIGQLLRSDDLATAWVA